INHDRAVRWMAMFSGVVNIAVFAAFRCVIGIALLSNAEFKPVCGPHQLDVSCYGWQRWHDRGKKRPDVARSAAKTARF
ncbi:MAG TPA: hypothetical protein VLJ14_04330, partial [Ktedonobacterales bacterium]|nr:hypothetical protein [Ktedonobacterales bacterium]